ncbi:hypothetical protein EMCRGX_G010957 [Ephydatia muelleri]
MKSSKDLNFEILGAPIGDFVFCAKYASQKHAKARSFCTCWRMLVLWILRWQCFSFVSVAVSERWYVLLILLLPLLWLMQCKCFIMTCTAVDAFGNSWQQAQLSLSRARGRLGLRSLSHHSAVAYISSVSASEQCSVSMSHLLTSVNLFNALIPSADTTTLDDIVSSPCHQHALSSKIENQLLFDHSSLPGRAHLLSVSSPNSAAWLSVLPSPGLNLHMDPPEFQVALKWWLGMDLAQGFNCTFCPSLALDRVIQVMVLVECTLRR